MKISKKLKEADSLDQLSLNTRKGLKGFAYRFAKNFKRDWQLHLMLLFPVVYMFIFHYIPIYGVQIAFRDYKAADGIVGSEWVGMKWFIKFFNNYKFKQIFFLYGLFITILYVGTSMHQGNCSAVWNAHSCRIYTIYYIMIVTLQSQFISFNLNFFNFVNNYLITFS